LPFACCKRKQEKGKTLTYYGGGKRQDLTPVLQPRAQHVQQSPPVHFIHKDRLPPIAA
jgi:hypothetical protein